MIKKVSVAFGIMFCSIIYIEALAQGKAKLPIDETTKKITFTSVSELPGISKDSLHTKAIAWCHEYFVNPTEVIRENNRKEGKIVCKPRFKIMNPADKKGTITEGGNVQYTLILQFKDGKYRYTMTDYNWKQPSYYEAEKWMDTENQYYKPEFEYYLQQIDEQANETSKNLHEFMAAKKPVKNDDW